MLHITRSNTLQCSSHDPFKHFEPSNRLHLFTSSKNLHQKMERKSLLQSYVCFAYASRDHVKCSRQYRCARHTHTHTPAVYTSNEYEYTIQCVIYIFMFYLYSFSLLSCASRIVLHNPPTIDVIETTTTATTTTTTHSGRIGELGK